MKKKINKKLDVVFILDKSGSMSGSEEHTITSFNEYLDKERNNKYNINITTMLFSDKYNYLYKRENINKVENITNKDYYVGGCTALYDSIGNAINYMDKEDTEEVLFIIITDGYENASLEYNKDKIRSMIKEHNKWNFIYIGADIDSYAAGKDIGIRRENIANYKKTSTGVSKLFKAVNKYECCMMEEDTSNWKEELD